MLRRLCLSLILGLGGLAGWTGEFTTSGMPRVSPVQSRPAASSPNPASSQTSPPSRPLAERTSVQDHLSEAQGLYRKGDFQGATQKYLQVLQEVPNSPEAYAGLARVYLKEKDVEQADATISKGIQVADSPPVRVALGEVYFREGKIPEAEREWVNVVNSGHEDARAFMGLARVRWAASMYKSGNEKINKAHQLDPTDPEISTLWAGTLSRAERVKYLEEYLAGDTNDDPETRADLMHYLEYLKARAKDPRRACHLVSKATSTETKLVPLNLDPKRLRGYGLSVAINGKKSQLLLDTGASGILMNRRLAEKAGVTELSETEIGGFGDKGSRTGYVALADSLQIGEMEFQDCIVHVIDQRSIGGEDGLIGADIFSAFLVDIDFPHEKLRLGPLPRRPQENTPEITLGTDREGSGLPAEQAAQHAGQDAPATSAPLRPFGPQDRYIAPEMKAYTQVYRFGHSLLVPTLIGDTASKLFILDTGSFSNLISTNAAREVTKVSGDYRRAVQGISGPVKKVFTADKAVLQFGHLRQENQEMVAFDLKHLSDRTGTEISGVLGFATLRMLEVKIDYRDGLVDFTYDPKLWGR